MENLSVALFIGIVLVAAMAALFLTTRLFRTAPLATAPRARPLDTVDLVQSYAFRDGYLLSDITAMDAFLEADVDRSAALDRLLAGLTDLNADVAASFNALRAEGRAFLLPGKIGADDLSISGRVEDGDVIVLSVGPAAQAKGRQMVDDNTLEALQTELAELRNVVDASPAPMWREDAQDTVVWANGAYVDLAEQMRDGERVGWPLPRLFSAQLDPAPSDGTIRRCLLDLPHREEASWFEISREALPDGTDFFTARPIDRLVRAETSLREFMQTLTKTFASLPIGLAVFDRRRQLVTFNPSLVALSDLDTQFLSNRPDLRSFLDRLRDHKRIPEPRDYRSWREEITRLEEGAEAGSYQEMWDLPGGLCYRVVGRPHPDGAIAFMFEDLSAEVSLTRQFRADLELFQAVIDASPAAIAIFRDDGSMVGTNAGYAKLWGDDPSDAADMPNLTRSSALWASQCKPTGLWGEVRQLVMDGHERGLWVEQVEMEDGTRLTVRMTPVRGQFTVLHFELADNAWSDPLADLVERHGGGAPQAQPELTQPAARTA